MPDTWVNRTGLWGYVFKKVGNHWLCWCSYPQWQHWPAVEDFFTILHNSPLSVLCFYCFLHSMLSQAWTSLSFHTVIPPFQAWNNPQLLVCIISPPFKHIIISPHSATVPRIRVSIYSTSMCSSLFCQVLNARYLAVLNTNKQLSN